MDGYADCLSITAPNLENMDSLFATTASKHADGVTSRRISSHILKIFPQESHKEKTKTNLENVSCNVVV